MRLRPFYPRLAATAAAALLASCGGPQQPALPTTPVETPPNGPQTIEGFPVTVAEYALPAGQCCAHSIIVGPDGAVYFAGKALTIVRVVGDGTMTSFKAPPTPPGDPEATWLGFPFIVSHNNAIWGLFTAEGGSFGHPYGYGLVQMALNGSFVNFSIVLPDVYLVDAQSVKNTIWLLYTGNVSSAVGAFRETVAGDAYSFTFGRDGYSWILYRPIGGPPTAVARFSPSGAAAGTFVFPQSSPEQITHIAAGADNAAWLNDGGSIVRLTATGATTRFPVPYAGSEVGDLALGSDGAIWFIDVGTNAIGRITTSGAITEYPVPTPHAFGAYFTPLENEALVSCPQACENAHGRIWFTEPNVSRIGKLQF